MDLGYPSRYKRESELKGVWYRILLEEQKAGKPMEDVLKEIGDKYSKGE
jgi:hypothetical protein